MCVYVQWFVALVVVVVTVVGGSGGRSGSKEVEVGSRW